MEPTTKIKPKSLPLLRVVVSEKNAATLDLWIGQLEQFCPGIRLKRQDLINWLVEERGGLLASPDLKAVKEQFYGEIELAQWALEQLKAAKIRNEKLTLNDLIKAGKNSDGDLPRKKSKPKVPPTFVNDPPQTEAAETLSDT